MRATLFAGCAVILSCLSAGPAVGQDAGGNASIERMVRELDGQEADAVLRGDFTVVERLWAPDLVVNNPFGQVVEGNRGPIRTGALTYSSFVREIESVQVHGNTVIVMGHETVVPKDDSPDAGRTIHRRYTNVWMSRDGEWRLTARHANVICTDADAV
jgi:ketosteroid isomerase-like protein